MLYNLLKFPAKIAFYFYCRSVKINNKNYLQLQGPLLIAANHPNSFLDAIVIATLFQRPVHSLTRGDVYKNSFYTRILTSLNMLPVFRISEGAENLEENYHTFDKCKEIFRNKGIVLIFSEGRCENEWHLRPLKKGTARLAISSWNDGIDLKILPTGINYQSFLRFGKNIEINFNEVIDRSNHDNDSTFGKSIANFNTLLNERLKPLVVEIDEKDTMSIQQHFLIKTPSALKLLLIIPAIIGWGIHAPLYSIIQQYAYKKAGKTGHYDSVIIAMLFIFYPFYLLITGIILSVFTPGFWWSTVFLFPLTAWCYIRIKRQF